MKVPYKVQLWGEAGKNHKAEDIYNITVLDGFDYCCTNMGEAWRDGFIGFGEREFNLGEITEVCIYKYAYGGYDEMPIKFCPFCGKQIETYEAKRTLFKYTGQVIKSSNNYTEVDA
jgi:hypothetical protein